jgi:diacylglycerol kinase family enzyme
MKVLCVLNPLAAGGLALQRWPLVAELLSGLGVEVTRLAVERDPLVAKVADFLAQPGADFDVVAGIGGDGTHSAILNGLMAFQARCPDRPLPPYAFIPLGTGNDMAKSFGIRIRDEFTLKDLRRAVSAIAHGADYRLDLGIIQGRYFADALTIGLDSRILRERNLHKRRLESIPVLRHLVSSRLLYTLSTGRPFLEQPEVRASIRIDGQVWYEGLVINVVINNTRIYAGDFDFATNAYADDGRLDVVLFTGHTDYLARYLLALRRNPDRVRELSDKLSKVLSHAQGERIQVSLSRAEPAQVDGEELPAATAFEVTVAPRALPIKTPAEPI